MIDMMTFFCASSVAICLLFKAVHRSSNRDSTHLASHHTDMADDEMDIKEGAAVDLDSQLHPNDGLFDIFEDFDGYEHMALVDEDDFDDLGAIRLIFNRNERKRGLKFKHRRLDWDSHIRMLVHRNEFETRF